MNISLVQPITVSTTGQTSLAYASNVSTGSLLVCAFNSTTGTVTSSIPTDTLGNTWLQAGTQTSVAAQTNIFYCLASKSAGANTVSLATGTGVFYLWEVTSLPKATVSLDQTSGTTGISPTCDPGALIPTNANEFLVAAAVNGTGNNITGGAAGWTFSHVINTEAVQTRIISSLGSQDGTFPNNLSSHWGAVSASFAFITGNPAASLRAKLKPFII